ncbi:MAG: hypothetical protein EP335_06585 [Alphaproteobacteria bacterium]|nr:MAG: hypothetical protein EP335_06585 [Alphaproteobacteria bacterium]
MKPLVPLVLAISLSACVTLEQVKTASNIIKLDNELEAEVRRDRNNPSAATFSLSDIAAEATARAQDADRAAADAISYYRIAATAYWQNHDPAQNTALAEVASLGQQACASVSEKERPDRDCFYLKLVVPFAAIEEAQRNVWPVDETDKGKTRFILDDVNMSDGASNKDIDLTNTAIKGLQNIRTGISALAKIGAENAPLPDNIEGYFCRNTTEAIVRFDGAASTLQSSVETYFRGNPTPNRLTVDLAGAGKLTEFIGTGSLAGVCGG